MMEDRRIHEWTADLVLQHIMQVINDHEARYNERMESQQRAVETAARTAQEALRSALDATEKAIAKSEVGVEKRADAVYVTIQKLQEALAGIMPRTESESRFASLSERVDSTSKRLDEKLDQVVKSLNEKIDPLATGYTLGLGRSTGLSAGWGYLVAAAGFAATILVIISFIR